MRGRQEELTGRKKSRANRKRMRQSGEGGEQDTAAPKRRRMEAKRRVTESMCYSQPTAGPGDATSTTTTVFWPSGSRGDKPLESVEDPRLPGVFRLAATALLGKGESTTGTKLQKEAWQEALKGKDVLAIGGDARDFLPAYLLPAVAHIGAQQKVEAGEGPVVVVVVPDKGTGAEVLRASRQLRNTGLTMRAVNVHEAAPLQKQQEGLAGQAIELVSCTPGRLAALLATKALPLGRASFLVVHDLAACLRKGAESALQDLLEAALPLRQAMLFSRKASPQVQRFASSWLQEPIARATGDDPKLEQIAVGKSDDAGPSTVGESSGKEQLQGDQPSAIFDTFVPFVGADSEGINKRRIKGGFLSPRVETVHKILLRVQESGVLILAATPCSGKTSLCQLVYEEAKKSTVFDSGSVYYVNCAEVGTGGRSFEDVFLEQARVSFSEASKSPKSSPEKQQQQQRPSGNPPSKKKLLILDELQTTYDTNAPGHSLLWPLLKRLLATKSEGINILLSASRGSNPSADGLANTPIAFSNDQRIPLRPRPGFGALSGTSISEPALQFTEDEYKQVFTSFCASIGFGSNLLQLKTLYDVIEATTERHPGSVLHILDVLKVQSPSNYAGRAHEWAVKVVELVTSPRLLGTLSGTRSFPNVDVLWDDQEALELIKKLLASGGEETLNVIRGWSPKIAKKAQELARSGHMLLEQDVISFTSGLHMEFYRYHLARRTWGTAKDMPSSIETFLAEALSKMKPPMLQESLNLNSRGGVLDAHFQFELYSAITSLLPEGAYLSPTVGTIYGLRAYVDFVLHGPRKWALELLVDGRDLKEHESRFGPKGRYHPMVLGKQIDAWIVVDLRNPNIGKPRRVRGPGVCHVFFESGYTKAMIDFGKGKKQEVILAGRG